VELQRAPLDLRDVVDSALHATRALFERHRLTASTRIAPARFELVGDATRLEQAINNVLANAAKYSESDGNVELSLVQCEAGWARIVVRDEGRGIPSDQLEAIFDIFVQVDVPLDRSRGGLGIGLALVRAIVQLHGGKVRADSAGLGHGSTFTIDLPLSGGAALEAGASGVSGVSGASGTDGIAAPLAAPAKRHVVIVEDNADARESLKALVGAFGHAVATAASGDAGLRLILDTRPDLAIVDLGLPVLDGFAVARGAREALGGNVRLVALTGYNSPQVRQQALEAGFDVHMAKPCTPEKLLEILAG
jgi:CheY-like chemotaxis protein